MYVDGFVVPVKTAHKEDYARLARVAAAVFLEYGAVRCMECWGDNVPEGKVTSFPFAVKLEADETALFSWIEWPDKATRDAAHARTAEDPRMTDMMQHDFVGWRRLVWGGFAMLLDERPNG
jgi:uncharacterized protein YbaA (DUF1428 family)